jgi:pimeloyl-ACP methyl ester carboxylesterase
VSNETPQFITSTDGTRIACYVQGDGPPLVLQYGALSERRFWGRLAPLLDGYRLYIVERRGRGESGDAPTYHPQLEAADLTAVLESIGEPAYLFAHSSGAVIALAAALEAPSLVRRAIFYEPPCIVKGGVRGDGYGEELPRRLRALAASGDRAGAIETFFREAPALPEADIERQKAGTIWKGLEPIAHTAEYDAGLTLVYNETTLAAPDNTLPIRFLHGEISPAWVLEGVRTLAAGIANSSVVELPKQGHVAMFTAPDLLAGEIKSFFSDR